MMVNINTGCFAHSNIGPGISMYSQSLFHGRGPHIKALIAFSLVMRFSLWEPLHLVITLFVQGITVIEAIAWRAIIINIQNQESNQHGLRWEMRPTFPPADWSRVITGPGYWPLIGWEMRPTFHSLLCSWTMCKLRRLPTQKTDTFGEFWTILKLTDVHSNWFLIVTRSLRITLLLSLAVYKEDEILSFEHWAETINHSNGGCFIKLILGLTVMKSDWDWLLNDKYYSHNRQRTTSSIVNMTNLTSSTCPH